MADLEFTDSRNGHPYGARCYLLWLQSPSGYFRSLHGHWCYIRSNGRNYGESHVQVNNYTLPHSLLPVTPHSRAYPQSGIFMVCTPDVPCITPGTYAFLGAAAALRFV